MSILVDRDSVVIVQGITGREGGFHTRRMIEYGTQVAGGVTPGKGGEWFEGKPVFDTVEQAVKVTGADVSMVAVPAAFAPDAICEAACAGIRLVICLTEFIPVQEMMKVMQHVHRNGCRLIGPNCPGLLSPGLAKIGIMPGFIATPGNVGVVSRSGHAHLRSRLRPVPGRYGPDNLHWHRRRSGHWHQFCGRVANVRG